MSQVEHEIAALQKLTTSELVNRYLELYGKPPRTKNRVHVWKRCAWKLQEIKFGGLSTVAKQRLEELIADLDLDQLLNQKSTVRVKAGKRSGDPAPGTELVREWQGQQVVVRVLESGYEYEGRVYTSLSAIAREVTGTRWNGPLWFGLRKRPA